MVSISLLWHIIFMHSVWNDYVICFEPDGNIEIENVNDCEECSIGLEESMLIESGIALIIDCECIDISLAGNCSEDEPLPIKNRVSIDVGKLKNNIPGFQIYTNNRFPIKSNPTLPANYILENYTTVSLII